MASGQAICLEKEKIIPNNTFTIHGLWPGKITGEQIPTCRDSEKNITISDPTLIKELSKYWTSSNKDDSKFWFHEYAKHGYCWEQRFYKDDNAERFFNFTLNFFHEKGFSTFFQDIFGDIETGEILITQRELDVLLNKRWPGIQYKLNCYKQKKTNHRIFTEMYFYYDLDFNPKKVPFKSDTNCGDIDQPIKIIFKLKEPPSN